MSDKVTFYPAVLPSADPVVLDSADGSPMELLDLLGIGPIEPRYITAKGPGQEGETGLDVEIPSRMLSAVGYFRASSMVNFWTQRAAVFKSFANRPVRFGEELELGRILIERDGMANREIYGGPKSMYVGLPSSQFLSKFDFEWLCPYPYFQDTADSSLTIPIAKTLQTSAASDDIIDCTGHGFSIGDAVRFPTLTGGAGLTVGTTYYVVATSFGANTFRVATTPGGAAIDFTTNITAGTVVKYTPATNSGDVDAPVLIKIFGPATEVTFTNLTTGDEFTVTVTLADHTQWLQVDTSTGVKYIRKYTAADVWTDAVAGLDLASPRLWRLHPGLNSIGLAAVGGTPGTTDAVMTWRNRYNGL